MSPERAAPSKIVLLNKQPKIFKGKCAAPSVLQFFDLPTPASRPGLHYAASSRLLGLRMMNKLHCLLHGTSTRFMAMSLSLEHRPTLTMKRAIGPVDRARTSSYYYRYVAI
jgi:hypothetical protein